MAEQPCDATTLTAPCPTGKCKYGHAGRCTGHRHRQPGRALKPCRGWPVRGSRTCRMHRGNEPKGVASPNWKHGRYSKYLPQRLLPRFHEALDDQTWASLRTDVGLLDARLSELVSQLDSGESGSLWMTLRKRWQDVQAARTDPPAMAAALTALGDAITAGASEQTKWGELAKLIDQRRTLVESERKRVLELQQVLTGEQAAALFSAITEAIKRHVTDRSQLSSITEELSRLALGDDARQSAGAR